MQGVCIRLCRIHTGNEKKSDENWLPFSSGPLHMLDRAHLYVATATRVRVVFSFGAVFCRPRRRFGFLALRCSAWKCSVENLSRVGWQAGRRVTPSPLPSAIDSAVGWQLRGVLSKADLNRWCVKRAALAYSFGFLHVCPSCVFPSMTFACNG